MTGVKPGAAAGAGVVPGASVSISLQGGPP
jgi:hypothetical protein